ncbi:hypothetical protein [Mycobacterium sp. URHB0044]|uniref:hypothetical protein n=1 Tax=Mycobacterium sp. URHB0044 TaxID=1380386 RepID=UPI00048E2A29|nr:hypothetical protein [Mycobacterium sp. URHB0044]
MLWNLTLLYIASAIVTAVIMLLATRRLVDERRPATHRVSLAIAGGLVWPLLLIGVVEFSSVMLLSMVHGTDDAEAGIAVLA